jgi:hypothetical protein
MTKMCYWALLAGCILLALSESLSAQEIGDTTGGFLDPRIVALLLGAFLALISNQVLEFLRRRQTRKSIASAFAGEINAIVQLSNDIQPAVTMTDYLNSLRSGNDIPFPLVIRDTKFEEVYTANVGNIGMLKGSMPERLVSFYTLLFNIRDDLRTVESGKYDNRGLEAKAKLVEQNLFLWDQLESQATGLVSDLREIAGK